MKLLEKYSPLLLFCFSLILWGCSENPTISGGGSDLPNGFATNLSGVIVGPDSTPLFSATVELRRITISHDGDNVATVDSFKTDSQGRFVLNGFKPGSYVLYAYDSSGQKTGISQNVEIQSDRDSLRADLQLCETVSIFGHVLPTNLLKRPALRIFVPGTGVSAFVKPDNTFLLTGVPKGHFVLAVASDSVVNYTRITIRNDAPPQILIRDLNFAMDDSFADESVGLFSSASTMKSYYVTPRRYVKNPDYYAELNLSVTYYSNSTGNKEWDCEGLPQPGSSYDYFYSGWVYRDSIGQVKMVRYQNHSITLIGEKTEAITSKKQYVAAALKLVTPQSTLDSAVFEVIELTFIDIKDREGQFQYGNQAHF